MNGMIGFLADFCGKHVLDEKIFVVPSYSIGHQIGRSLVRKAGSWINLRFMTVSDLAQEVSAAELEAAGKTELTETELLIRVDALFRELKAGERLEYFHRLEPVPGVIKALHDAVQSLRSAGIRAEDLKTSSFRVGAKGEDLSLLLGLYEELLERENVLDRPGLILFALESKRSGTGAGNEPAWMLCLRDRSLGRIEKELVRTVAAGRLVLVPGDPVFGLDRPDLFWEEEPGSGDPPPPPASDAQRLSWLFDPRAVREPFRDGTLSLFRAVGPTNECREVLRRVLAEKDLFDEVEVIHPPGTAYTTVFHLLAERARIPMTFAEGVPISFTSPGRAFFGLADWIENGFLVRDLCDLIKAGDFALPWGAAGGVTPEAVCRHLAGAGIVRGRERYLDRLAALRGSYESLLRRETPGDEEERTAEEIENLRRTSAEITWLEEAVKDLLDVFTGIGQGGEGMPSDFRLLCEGFVRVLQTSVPARTELDREALEAVLSLLRQAMGNIRIPDLSGTLPLADSLERLRTLVSSLSVGASPPLPGHLHVSSFASGGFSGRPLTHLVGLGDTGITGSGLQDPLLLDDERRAVSEALPTSTERLRRDLYSVASLLASLRGRVVLSYPSYDILEERDSFPSSLVLQAHRLVRGDPGLDYSKLDGDLGAAVGFLPRDPKAALDETDWWFARLESDGRFLDGLSSVRDNFPELGSGLASVEARAGEKLTAYEGIVRLDPGRHDPLSNHGIVLSASRLERLAKCPYGYFLRHVLRVEPPQILEFDPSRWLDPMQRGSLLHEILCDFMREVRGRKETVDPDLHRPLMDETADRVIDSWKRTVPPPSEAILKKERRDMRETLEVFLVAEKRRKEKVEPLDFEKRFADVEISITGGRSFLLRGVIDRIDQRAPGAYRILDYKTGSPRLYEGLVGFGKGRIIQHALYAVAAEEVLRREGRDPRPRVTESGYYFPTRRGEGLEIMVGEFDREEFKRLLADLLGLVVKGYFIAGPRADCEYCDFASVCDGAPKGTKEKIEANPEILEAYERLSRYE